MGKISKAKKKRGRHGTNSGKRVSGQPRPIVKAEKWRSIPKRKPVPRKRE